MKGGATKMWWLLVQWLNWWTFWCRLWALLWINGLMAVSLLTAPGGLQWCCVDGVDGLYCLPVHGPKHPWFSNTGGTYYTTTSLTYSLFLKDIHMQNMDWVELGYKFMRTNGDIPPTVFMFGNWTEYNFSIISGWTLFQYQYHLKRTFQHDLTTVCYFFHTYMHIPQNEGSNQNKKVRTR